MFDAPDDTGTPGDIAVSRREAAPDIDPVAGKVGHDDTDDADDATPEEAGYGYGV